jgi:hypothetical protein
MALMRVRSTPYRFAKAVWLPSRSDNIIGIKDSCLMADPVGKAYFGFPFHGPFPTGKLRRAGSVKRVNAISLI